MLSKLFVNKKLVVIVVILCLILCIGIWFIVGPDTKKTDDKGTNVEQEDNNGLEIVNPDEEMTDNTTDASGAWDDTKAPATQPSDDTNDTDKQDHEEEQTESNESDDSEEKEDILEDDVIWGEIY